MKLSDFDYDLDETKIATRPAVPRDSSKMLVSANGVISHQVFRDLPNQLRKGDLLILNNTKVIPGRLQGVRRRETEHGSGVAHVEFTLLERIKATQWMTLAKPAKRLLPDDIVELGPHKIRVLSKNGGQVLIEEVSEGALSFDTLAQIGDMPLPPYIAKLRETDDQDKSDYQTVFASEEGAVAAPTASLHFTENVFRNLDHAGVDRAFVTLHVGAGTFLPVTEDDISNHKMHSEWFDISAETISKMEQAWAQGGRVIPVGTTALRTIESAARGYRHLTPGSGETDIFITPGYQFKATDGLITNFHLPKSTLLMLVAALAGFDHMQEIYRTALENDYRFFSYGDSSLILPMSQSGYRPITS